MSEYAPQGQPDILTEARTYPTFDAWLSQVPDERLQQIVNTIDRKDNEEPTPDDESAIADLVGVAMYFSGGEAMSIEEVTKAFHTLIVQIGIEIHVRNGILDKEGEYALTPDGQNAVFHMTAKGAEVFGKGGDKEQ